MTVACSEELLARSFQAARELKKRRRDRLSRLNFNREKSKGNCEKTWTQM